VRSCSSDIQREREKQQGHSPFLEPSGGVFPILFAIPKSVKDSGIRSLQDDFAGLKEYFEWDLKATVPVREEKGVRSYSQFEIVDDLEAALEQFRLIANDFGEAPENGNMSESIQGKV
jgi:hypothetical protein